MLDFLGYEFISDNVDRYKNQQNISKGYDTIRLFAKTNKKSKPHKI